MSAFAAYVNLDGRPVDADRMPHALKALEKFGSDGARYGMFGAAGFAHCLLISTADDSYESQPYADPGENAVFAGNVRLFNRESVGAALGIGRATLSRTADGELAFRAYQKWGADCVLHLVGDFGFVVWHQHSGDLFAATDPFCRKPVFYHLTDRLFAAASRISGLTCHPEVPLELDTRRLAALAIGYLFQPGRTHYKAVRYVPPGHTMHVKAGLAQLRRYWRPEEVPLADLGRRENYSEAYRALLAEVTHQQLRGIGPAGLKFSGGLDSSSLAAVAKPMLQDEGRDLICFAGVAPQHLGAVVRDARRWVELTSAHLGLNVRMVTSEGKSLLGDPVADVRDGEHMPWHLFGIYGWIYEEARNAGARIIVDGIAGDYGASIKVYGAFLPALKRGRLRAAFRDARVEWRRRGRQFVPNYAAKTALGVLAPGLLAAIQTKRHIRNPFTDSLRALKPGFIDASGLSEDLESKPVETTFIRPIGARAFMLQSIAHAGAEAWSLTDGRVDAFGLENRQPFTDRRLIEFALATPEEFHFEDGWNRALMRNAMKADLPHELIWRTEMNSYAVPDLPHRLVAAKQVLLDLSHELERSAPFADGFDWKYVRKTIAEYDGSSDLTDMGKAVRATVAISAADMARIASGRN